MKRWFKAVRAYGFAWFFLALAGLNFATGGEAERWLLAATQLATAAVFFACYRIKQLAVARGERVADLEAALEMRDALESKVRLRTPCTANATPGSTVVLTIGLEQVEISVSHATRLEFK